VYLLFKSLPTWIFHLVPCWPIQVEVGLLVCSEYTSGAWPPSLISTNPDVMSASPQTSPTALPDLENKRYRHIMHMAVWNLVAIKHTITTNDTHTSGS